MVRSTQQTPSLELTPLRPFRYTWLFCQRFDKTNQNSPALPFDEYTVGAFIEENSTQEDLRKFGLAHLKRNRLADGRISQQRGFKSTTPIWSRRPEIINKVTSKPRRGLQTPGGITSLSSGTSSGPRPIGPASLTRQSAQQVRSMEAGRRSQPLASSSRQSHRIGKPYNAPPPQQHSTNPLGWADIPASTPSDTSVRAGRNRERISEVTGRPQSATNSNGSFTTAAVVPPFPLHGANGGTDLAQRKHPYMWNH